MSNDTLIVSSHHAVPRRETDCDFLLRVLSDGEPHNLNEILRRSFRERDCGLTTHSRAADLRKQGHVIANWREGQRGDGSWYRLLSPLEAAPVVEDRVWPLSSGVHAGAASSGGGINDGPPSPVGDDGTAAQLSLLEVAA